MAETKKTKAEIAKKKEQVKKKLAKKKEPERYVPEPEPELKGLDLQLGDELLVKTDEKQIRENIDLDSKYAPASQKRGDVSVKPEFSIKEDDDITKNGDYVREKEFKLKFGVGL